MRLPGSLRARITLAALAALAVSGALAGGVLLGAIERDGRGAVDRDLRQRAERILGAPHAGLDERPGDGGGGGDPLLAGSDTFVQVAVAGRVVQQQGDVPAAPPPVPGRDGLATVRIDGQPCGR